MSQNYPEKNLI